MDRFLIKINKKGAGKLEEDTTINEGSMSQMNHKEHEECLEKPVSKKY